LHVPVQHRERDRLRPARRPGPEHAQLHRQQRYLCRYLFFQYVDGNPLFFPVDGDPFSASESSYAQIPSTPIGMCDTGGTWPYDVDETGERVRHNFSFTSEIRYWFRCEAGKSYTLDVAGDDDVWVFINHRLAVDLGGIHMPVAGSVTLDDTTAASYGLAPGNVYEVAVFQAERQSTSSTFKITLTGFNLAPSQCHRL
jgi:fibro-slime domain-containing protein